MLNYFSMAPEDMGSDEEDMGYSLMGPEGQEVLPEDRLSLSYHVVGQRQAGFNERGGLELSSQWVPGVPEIRQGFLGGYRTRGRRYRTNLFRKRVRQGFISWSRTRGRLYRTNENGPTVAIPL